MRQGPYLPETFWSKVSIHTDDDCWHWLGSKVGGYGHYRHNGKVKKAHRVMFESRCGSIPEGKIIMHSCDTRDCVNPAHLSIGTVGDNNKDRDRKGRQVAKKGEEHGMAKLHAVGVQKIRELQRHQQIERNQLAVELGVSYTAIVDVMNGRTWKWFS